MPLVMQVDHNLDKFREKAFKVKDIRAAARQAAEIAGDKALELFAKVVRTWRTETNFWYRTAETNEGIKLTFFTDNPKFKFVDEGTAVRYAVMTPDFIARTKPNVLGSFTGKGGLWYMLRKGMEAKPGLQARNFSEIITERTGPTFRGALQRELSEALETGKITKKVVKDKVTHGGEKARREVSTWTARQLGGRIVALAHQQNVGKKQKRKK